MIRDGAHIQVFQSGLFWIDMELDQAIAVRNALEAANHGFDVEEYVRMHKTAYWSKARNAYIDALDLAKNSGGYRRAHYKLTCMIERLAA